LRRVREKFGRSTKGDEKVPFATFVWSLVLHALCADGSLGKHLRTVSGTMITDAAAQARRAGLSWAWFLALFDQVLRPLAQRKTHPESFYHTMRVIAVDGSSWSLRNTPNNTQEAAPRHRNQKGGSAAFLKMSCAVLLEVGTHQPLAVACEQGGLGRAEGELTLARRLLGAIPRDEDTLLLGDRLYGCGRFIHEVREQAGPRAQLLVRVKKSLKAKITQVLHDGSALIEVRVNHVGSNRLEAKLRLREVRGQVWRQSAGVIKCVEVRLWTTLLDAEKYPAEELLTLYAQRWEQELFFRELKSHVGREHLLRAGTMQGAQAEFGALILAAGVLAQQRVAVADKLDVPPVRVSITKISSGLAALLPVLAVAGDLITEKQRQAIIKKFMAHLSREAIIAPRRKRTCQRGLRKTTTAWPRIKTRCNATGDLAYKVIPLTIP